MKAKSDNMRKLGKANAVELTETDLDQLQGGAGERLTQESTSTRSKKPSSSAVGHHEVSGALVKIN